MSPRGTLLALLAVATLTGCQLVPVVPAARVVHAPAGGVTLVVVAGEPAANAPEADRLAVEAALALRARGWSAQAVAAWREEHPERAALLSVRVLAGTPAQAELAALAGAGVTRLVVIRLERLDPAWGRDGRRGILALSTRLLPTGDAAPPATVTVLAEAEDPPGATFATLRHRAVERLADALVGLPAL